MPEIQMAFSNEDNQRPEIEMWEYNFGETNEYWIFLVRIILNYVYVEPFEWRYKTWWDHDGKDTNRKKCILTFWWITGFPIVNYNFVFQQDLKVIAHM